MAERKTGQYWIGNPVAWFEYLILEADKRLQEYKKKKKNKQNKSGKWSDLMEEEDNGYSV